MLHELPESPGSGQALGMLGGPGICWDTGEWSRQWASLWLLCCLGQPLSAPWLRSETLGEDMAPALLSLFLLPSEAEARVKVGQQPLAASPEPKWPMSRANLVPNPPLAWGCLVPSPLASACGSLFLKVGEPGLPLWVALDEEVTAFILLGWPWCHSPPSLDSS